MYTKQEYLEKLQEIDRIPIETFTDESILWAQEEWIDFWRDDVSCASWGQYDEEGNFRIICLNLYSHNPPTEETEIDFDEYSDTMDDKVAEDSLKALGVDFAGFPLTTSILYGVSAAGLFIAGTAVKSVVPKYNWIGWILQIATVIPVGMLGLLMYEYFKEFELSTEELEMLAQ